MKKSILSALVLASSLVGLASCGGGKTSSSAPISTPAPTTSTTPTPAPVGETARGVFSYSQTWDDVHFTTYGTAVSVTIADGKITALTRDAAYVTENNLVEITPSWQPGEAFREVYEESLSTYFSKLIGKEAQTVYKDISQGVSITKGETKGAMTFSVSNDSLKVFTSTGATQTEARTNYAIANGIAAILKLDALDVEIIPDDAGGDQTTTTTPVAA